MSLFHAAGLTLLPNLGGLTSGFISKNQINEWYDIRLQKPSWAVSGSSFVPIKTAVYTSMGYASFLIFRDGVGDKQNLALGLYATQLLIDWLWGPLFFNAHQYTLSVGLSALLAANIGGCIWSFNQINKNAAYLMIPALVWALYTTMLTFNIAQRKVNKNVD